MKKYLEILEHSALFDGISSENLIAMLSCLGGKKESYRKKETILSEGSSIGQIGIVLSGAVQIEMNDYYGNRSIIGSALP